MTQDKNSKMKSEALSLASNKEGNNLALNLAFANYKEFMAFCNEIAGSNLSPLKAPKDVAIAILAGHSLGISVTAALNNIVPINGRATLSNNLQMGLCLREGIIIEILEDAESIYPLYIYDYDDKCQVVRVPHPNKPNETIPKILETKHLFKSDIDKAIEDWKQKKADNMFISDAESEMFKPKVSFKPAGKGTKVRLTRQVKQPDGTFKEMVVTREFTSIMAHNIKDKDGADVYEIKPTWQNYEEAMLFANAIRRVILVIGNDLTLNLPSTQEMVDTTNIKYTLDEDGNITVEDVEHEDVTNKTNNDTAEKGSDIGQDNDTKVNGNDNNDGNDNSQSKNNP